MHIHATPANSAVIGLASAKATEVSLALRRARQLRNTAIKLKASSLNLNPDGADDPETVELIGAWVGTGSSSRQIQQPKGFPVDSNSLCAPAQIHENRRSTAADPVSFWA